MTSSLLKFELDHFLKAESILTKEAASLACLPLEKWFSSASPLCALGKEKELQDARVSYSTGGFSWGPLMTLCTCSCTIQLHPSQVTTFLLSEMRVQKYTPNAAPEQEWREADAQLSVSMLYPQGQGPQHGPGQAVTSLAWITASQLVSLLPSCPTILCYVHSSQNDSFKTSHPITSLQPLLIIYRPCVIWLWVSSNLTCHPLLFPYHPPAILAPCLFLKYASMLLPQDLCTCCFHYLEHSFPRHLQAYALVAFGFLLKFSFIIKALPDQAT